jgi:ribonuclease BN (tRNA processing enzyme)
MTRVTIVGSGTSAPQPETPASGILVESTSTGILIDCGQGVIRGLMPIRDPRELDAILVGHLHADHYIDIVSLRYLLPWADYTGRRMPILLPPGGRQRMDELASAISERSGFFDHTFDIVEYDPAAQLTIGDLAIEFLPGRHYVPAWGCAITDGAGRRVVISGDTGPNEPLVEVARGADLFVVESTLLTAGEDDPNRGHLTVDEALDMGRRAGVGQTVLVHYRPQNREAIAAACLSRVDAVAGVPGLVLEVDKSARPKGGGQADGKRGAEVGSSAGIASRAARAR